MLRLSKPVQLLEWGEGTNTKNQIWIELGQGSVVEKPKTVNGITTIRFQLSGQAAKKNPTDDSIKVMQVGEGMTVNSDQRWGEVCFGRLKNITSSGGGSIVEVETTHAFKFGR